MKKNEAMERIQDAISKCRVSTCFEDVEAFGMALRALENMPEEDSLDSIKDANTQRYVEAIPREQLKKIVSIYDGTLVSMILAFSRVQELTED